MSIFPDKQPGAKSPLGEHSVVKVPIGAGNLDETKTIVEVEDLKFYRGAGGAEVNGATATGDYSQWILLANAKFANFVLYGAGALAEQTLIEAVFSAEKPTRTPGGGDVQRFDDKRFAAKGANDQTKVHHDEHEMPVWARVKLTVGNPAGVISGFVQTLRKREF